ncbi:MAG TPA: methyl-accepting chemotaxis protein [Ideonella sp.]|uniref:methyl-accepting chemotaxis protein n=1 Tax=Ideonella sp. TaxID=1929293 RepID=UPI002BF277EA|nr:methyl-accepting chemotaxis protein [Ideonella sp.]HSI48690.1 methyl-accepting chemotaxis protein [Ideonella sp.]
MNVLSNLKVAHRLLAAFGVCILLITATGALGVIWLRHLGSMQQEMVDSEVVPSHLAGTAAWQAATHFRRQYPYILKHDEKARAESLELNEKSAGEITKAIDFERSHPTSAEQRQLVADFDTHWPAYLASTRKIQAAVKADDTEAAFAELNATTDGLHVKLRKLFIQLGDMRLKSAQERALHGTAIVNAAAWQVLALVAAGLLVAAGAAVLVTRSILRQIGGEPGQAVEVARGVAAGDLSARIVLRPGDSDSLLAQLKAMQQSLSQVVGRVRQNAESVATASGEISQGNNDLSSRTEQQASALQETAASMEQLGATVTQNSHNAQLANQLARSASEVAGQGGEVVGQVVATMGEIQTSSKRIADIISVIDGIAFQTNILALNAAVEAARAGEQGRGFAVVASEVRGLAGRSAAAAKEIRQLISASVERVEQGSALVDRAGSTMNDVVTSIRRVSDIIGEITSSSGEQKAGMTQVGSAMAQIDRTTQQNAALVEQSAAAAESLSQQAQQLVQVVSTFKIAAGVH